ncbi:MAG: Uma2 family endonuclease [Prochlorotrichaceae cyanobacterium]
MVSLHTLAIPPLENGDRLTRPEFERRYQATPEHCKAELIEGVVYMASPVRAFHGTPHAALMGWLTVYWAATPGVSAADNTTTLLDQNNELQPDALLRIEVGGRSSLSEEGYIEGAPELVAEVATSSAAIDLGTKKEVYRRNGVQDYLVWQTFGNRLDWFQLEAEQFVAVEPDAEGIIRSRVFPGLWLAVPALLAGNMLEVLTVLQRGIADPSHQAFVERLQVQS